ncbi:hypothetical protein CLAFUW4_06222 [Fulvia fulva]|uniref:Uncharacterized protein n=1 Tax=Passalora fulva TaxID=5499 RepID=A0A9Q8LJE3_PASFU|nr:uncharacterized protein CLAFUR5_06365 [Fulvia fulva]KAK4624531.1 hypothetical protein CLAFUR4_06225 [Fulvia fulva]KAK4625387.1 hypothetical protein CLAFUR0_06229 [Fulvia fulva]UJO18249.1 hypothetical protein CLAFUR5_06365 [Fulvia fulva]WPV14725.1 hypothetical protein CLAFUW4_06222 [Fulvia fulva]WPV29588.1 hypothetical protein CLAFUW7_06218 [Fulvia fulva]
MSDTTSLSSQVKKLNLADAPATPSSSSSTQPSELVAVVDDLLNQLTTKFNTVSADILAKMDSMSQRLDALESQIQAGNAAAAAETDNEDK